MLWELLGKCGMQMKHFEFEFQSERKKERESMKQTEDTFIAFSLVSNRSKETATTATTSEELSIHHTGVRFGSE